MWSMTNDRKNRPSVIRIAPRPILRQLGAVGSCLGILRGCKLVTFGDNARNADPTENKGFLPGSKCDSLIVGREYASPCGRRKPHAPDVNIRRS